LPWPAESLPECLPELVQDHPDIRFAERSRRPLPVKYEPAAAGLQYVAGLYHLRDYEPGSDIDACFHGHIAISRIDL
jgi:hypothetical protein